MYQNPKAIAQIEIILKIKWLQSLVSFKIIRKMPKSKVEILITTTLESYASPNLYLDYSFRAKQNILASI